MKEKEVRARLTRIKQSIAKLAQVRQEAEQKRNDLFAQIMSEINQDHARMVALVRTAQYELIFDQIINERDNDIGDDDVDVM